MPVMQLLGSEFCSILGPTVRLDRAESIKAAAELTRATNQVTDNGRMLSQLQLCHGTARYNCNSKRIRILNYVHIT